MKQARVVSTLKAERKKKHFRYTDISDRQTKSISPASCFYRCVRALTSDLNILCHAWAGFFSLLSVICSLERRLNNEHNMLIHIIQEVSKWYSVCSFLCCASTWPHQPSLRLSNILWCRFIGMRLYRRRRHLSSFRAFFRSVKMAKGGLQRKRIVCLFS